MQLPEQETRDLLDSLALGPVIVRGHYEHDVKRFGDLYACGDVHARDQMKDVLINLQMSLVITLKTVYMDGIDLDFLALQSASDDCRVNAGVCLGQLSQRLSDVTKSQAFHPPGSSYFSGASGLVPPLSPSLGFSSGRSTLSSAAFASPRTPDAMTEHFGQLTVSPQFFRPSVEDRKIYEERKFSMSSAASQEHHIRPQSVGMHRAPDEAQNAALSIGVHRIDETEERSARRRSSQALALDDNILLMFPQPGGQPIMPTPANGQDLDVESNVSSGHQSRISSTAGLSRASTGHRSQGSRDRFGPEDYGEPITRADGRQFSNDTVYDMYLPKSPEKQPSASRSPRASATGATTVDHVRYLQENSRPPRREPRSDSLNLAKRSGKDGPRRPVRSHTDGLSSTTEILPRSTLSVPISIEPSHPPPPRTPPPSGPLPQPPSLAHQSVSSHHLSVSSVPKSERGLSILTAGSSTAPSTPATPLTGTGPLTLPTDKNLLGFCKGAFRLQAGMERKAFTVNNRPMGFSGMSAYWRCDKCNFEGPVHQSINTSDDKKKKGKPEKAFDPKIRISDGGGIRYRWTFLAKCHVTLKGNVSGDTPKDGSFGSFGCVFCCAEGKTRGWLDLSNSGGVVGGPVAGANLSIKSGRSSQLISNGDGAVGVQATPIFGNVTSFMQHLDTVHRHQDGWPNAEMVGRFRVVVGRVASMNDANWEVNFVPR